VTKERKYCKIFNYKKFLYFDENIETLAISRKFKTNTATENETLRPIAFFNHTSATDILFYSSI
jgi:hypothetical protein